MKHPKLVKIQSALSKFFIDFKDDGILSVSETEDTTPFCHFVFDSRYPKIILLSIAVDYPNSNTLAEVIIEANRVAKIELSEPFYVSHHTHETVFSQEAYNRWDLDQIDLELSEPESKELH